MLFRVFWNDAPRWLYTPIYMALGWAAVFYFGDFVAHASTAVSVLMAVGGGLYTLGGVVYGFQRPNPFPRWFGFHEVFHTLTIAAFVDPLRRASRSRRTPCAETALVQRIRCDPGRTSSTGLRSIRPIFT